MIGKTLGHYEVGGQLGRGGMGEVFLADDLSLGRRVALKFLPDLFTSDPDRMARFEREAKLLAALNHPNIGAIYVSCCSQISGEMATGASLGCSDFGTHCDGRRSGCM